jgi:2-oxoacid:acceptor oxidoreductase delta subunit (pyruvate/2-ketoisovalerate family)
MEDVLAIRNRRPAFAMSTGDMAWNKTGSWRYMRPRYEDKVPPCTVGCPTGEKIPQYFALVKQKKYTAAWHLILEDNPLPGVCGRVCYHPCESACNRTELDEPIAINQMERFVADQNFHNSFPDHFRVARNGLRVAVIGSGPAGLSAAYQLARRGYEPVIFEAHPEAGGMLRVGIPRYRLPRRVLDKELADIQSLGVQFRLNTRVGRDVPWAALQRDYAAILIATGAHRNRTLGVPGETLEGISNGLEFLTRYNLTGESHLARRVLVVGGGNTAIDTARTALRLGAEVTIVYRRSRAEMPAVPEEIEAAESEGIRWQFLTTPVAFLGNGKLEKVRLIRMRLGEPDASGRRRPIPVDGSEFEVEVDQVLLAIGEQPVLDFLPEEIPREWGRVAVSPAQVAGRDGVFACGDAAAGPVGTVVDAIATGKRAALAIDQFLQTGTVSEPAPREAEVPFSAVNLDYFREAERPPRRQLSHRQARTGFDEVNLGLEPAEAVRETERCFSCGTCTYCDTCLIFCPDVAIRRNPGADGGNGYTINYDYCKGCGVCVQECPRNAMSFVEELTWDRS